MFPGPFQFLKFAATSTTSSRRKRNLGRLILFEKEAWGRLILFEKRNLGAFNIIFTLNANYLLVSTQYWKNNTGIICITYTISVFGSR